MNISVCIATFNGEQHVLEQLESIISQLSENDEVIIVDDCSNDNTVNIIRKFNDHRIKLFLNEKNRGHVYTFGKAIQFSSKEYVFLSDQDDIWTPKRLRTMKEYLLKNRKMLITAGYEFFNTNKRYQSCIPTPVKRERDSKKYLFNVLTIFKGNSGYVGCCMVFPKQFKRIILPIPIYVESHDLWLALASNLMRSNSHAEEVVLMRRLHCNNASMVRRNLMSKILSRFIFLISIFNLLFRIHCSARQQK